MADNSEPTTAQCFFEYHWLFAVCVIKAVIYVFFSVLAMICLLTICKRKKNNWMLIWFFTCLFLWTAFSVIPNGVLVFGKLASWIVNLAFASPLYFMFLAFISFALHVRYQGKRKAQALESTPILEQRL